MEADVTPGTKIRKRTEDAALYRVMNEEIFCKEDR